MPDRFAARGYEMCSADTRYEVCASARALSEAKALKTQDLWRTPFIALGTESDSIGLGLSRPGCEWTTPTMLSLFRRPFAIRTYSFGERMNWSGTNARFVQMITIATRMQELLRFGHMTYSRANDKEMGDLYLILPSRSLNR